MGQRMISLKFKRRKSVKRELSRIQKRIQYLSNDDLAAWAESSIYDVARNISGWRKHQDSFHLKEATMAAEVLFEALNTISRREENA
jgi:hypothetical protein